MSKFQRKKKYRKRLLSVFMAAVLVIQNGIPVLAETPEKRTESETLSETGTDNSSEESTTEKHETGKSSSEESAAEETDVDESLTEEKETEKSASEESSSNESTLDETKSEESSSAESSTDKSSEEESSTEEEMTNTTEENNTTEEATTEETTTEESTTEAEPTETETEESTATEEISVGAAESTNAEGGNVLKNGSFEAVTKKTGTKWTNELAPDEFDDGKIWEATVGTGMSFSIEDTTEAKDGEKAFHIVSTNKTPRWGFKQANIPIDINKKYECTFWVKADNVITDNGGIYLRMTRMVPGDGTKENDISEKIKGTTDGWQQYRFTTEKLKFENGNLLQFEIFADYMTGEAWIDDIRITPIEDDTEEGDTLTLNRTTLTLTTQNTYQLKASGADGEEITWASDNEDVATVDSEGLVTAVAEGKATITATVNDKKVSCVVTVVKGMIPDDKAIWWDDVETSIISEDTNIQKYWKDGEAPEGWTTGFNTATKVQFQLVQDETHTGGQAIYGNSNAVESGSTKISLVNVLKDDSGQMTFNYNKNYLLRAWVKTKDISLAAPSDWKGLIFRAGVGSNRIVDNIQILGTSDWKCYELELSSEKIQEALEKNNETNKESGKIQVEFVFEQVKGEVWIDTLELVEDYKFLLDPKKLTMDVRKTEQLKMIGAPIDSSVTWKSSDDKIATVDENGLITAVAPGKTTITAMIDEDHSDTCEIRVKDPADEAKFETMRERWLNRLTGNDKWNNGSPSDDYQAILDKYKENAKKAWDLYKGDANHADGIFGLTLDQSKFGTSMSDAPSESEPFYKVFQYIQDMAIVYVAEGSGSEYYQNADLKKDILEALEWAYDNIYNENLKNDAMFGNWFHWWISIPQSLAGTVILMHDELEIDNPELLDNLGKALAHFNEDPAWVYKVKKVSGGKMEMTFANLADTSLASLLRGVAYSDPDAVENGVKYVGKILQTVTSGDGIYADGSLIQHTNLAYTAGYGATALNKLEGIFYLSDSTDWEVSAENSAPVWTWIWEGIRPLFTDGAIFDMVNGRGMSRPTSSDLKSGRGMLESTAMLVKYAPEEWRAKLQGFVKTQVNAGIEGMGGETKYFEGRNADAVSTLKALLSDESIVPLEEEPYAKVFGSMDKAVAHSDKFTFGLSYSSGRTGRFEYGNGENAKGWHQGDGAVYIYNGDQSQYSDNYWNTVDNNRLAGITTDHSEWTLHAWGNYPGNANFNGGSFVGQFASIAMNFKNYDTKGNYTDDDKDTNINPNLTARKAWFVFDNEVVALGSGITGINTSRTTETIVDNKKINGNNELIIDGEAQSTAVDGASKRKDNVSWAWMEGNTSKDAIGYYFPEGSKLDVLRETRKSDWHGVNTSVTNEANPGSDSTYLSLAVPHGENADNKLASFKKENYSYVLLPSMGSQEVKSYAENPDIQVLCNSTFAQAVVDHSANAEGYIFWGDTGTQTIRIGNVEALKGSVTIVKDPETHTMRVGMADVHQNNSSLTFRIYGNGLHMVEANGKVEAAFDKYGAKLTVDTKDAMGATIEVTLGYEDLPQEQLDEIAEMRAKYANSLTGNDLSEQSKADAEYKAYMEKCESAVEEALAQINMDAGKGTQLFKDLPLLDWANKGSVNGDGSATLTTTTTRIKNLVVAYKSDGTKYYHDKDIKAAIDVCMEYLISGFPNILNYHDRVFANWWDWSIGVPKDLTVIGILLYDDLDQRYRDELTNLIRLLVPDVNYYWGRNADGRAARVSATGANGTEMAMDTVLNGLIANDPVSLYKASDTMINELRYVENGTEGFYKDGSYRQHGNFAYTGAYGVEKLRGVTTLATVLYNTTWTPEGVDQNIVYEWILNSFRPLYADGGIFDMVQGRSISRFNRSDITTGRYAMDAIVRLAADAPEQYKSKINSFAKTQAALGVAYDAKSYYGGMKSLSSLMIVRNLLEDDSIPLDNELYTKIYGSMDKAVTHGEDYTLGFSMFSSRMGGVESINNENLKGWNTSDGALTLYNGDQGQFGEGFWASVDHTRLAGITTNHETKSMTSNNIQTNDRDWVGGSALKTENYASVGMDFKSTISDLEAKKSWFVFGDQIVALGAGITTTAGDYTETIVENRKIDGDNQLLVDGSEAVAADSTEKLTAKWAWLSKNAKGSAIGYYFPEETQIALKRETRTGKWSEVNINVNAGDANEVTNKYLSIAVEHGTNPTDASYSYVLLPGKTSKEMGTYAEVNGIEILSNTEKLQAAADTVLGVSGYNFWAAGESIVPEQNGITKLTSDAAVSITMLNDGNKNIHLVISDPTQKSSTIVLRLEGAGLAAVSNDEGVTVTSDATGVTITVNVSGRLGEALNAVISSADAKPGEMKYATVTLHYPDQSIQQESVKRDTKFSDPIVEGEDENGKYVIKWYVDAEMTTLYDFDSVVSKDIDLYGTYVYYETNKVVVTLNYPDGTAKTEILKKDEKLSKPEFEDEVDGKKRGIKWYTDEAKTILYDFNMAVNADMTLYGVYYFLDEAEKVTAVFHYPEGKTETIIVEFYAKLTRPAYEDEVDGRKRGIKWYTDEAKTILYDFDTSVSKNIDLYGAYYFLDEPGAEKVVVTFHYPDETIKMLELEPNAKAEKPVFEDEVDGRKRGIKWYTDEAKTILYDFDTSVSKNIDLYGAYYFLDEPGAEKVVVTFHYPDETIKTLELESNAKVEKPIFEGKDDNGKYGILWYVDVELTELYDFNTAISTNIDLYGSYSYYYEEIDKDETIKTGIWVSRINEQQYTGKAIKPAVIVYDGTTRLKEKTDYKVSYGNNKKVGTAKITITPCGNYEKASKFSVNFEIVQRQLTKENVTIKYTPVMNVKRNKQNAVVAQTPKKITLKYGTVTVPAKEYTVTYTTQTGEVVDKLTDAGAYKMTVKTKPESSFAADLVYDVVLTDKILVDALKISVPTQTWTGSALKPEMTVKYKNQDVTKLASNEQSEKKLTDIFDIEYVNNTNAGTASVTLTAKENSDYYGSRTVNFQIKGTDIKKARIEGFQSTISYTGDERTQDATLILNKGKADERTLQINKDYTVTYTNNINAGKATMIITGIGELSGTVKKTFTVGKVNLKNATGVNVCFAEAGAIEVLQDKSGAKVAVNVTYGDKLLVPDVDYKVSYTANKAVGTAKVSVKGLGNYTGDLNNILTFEIRPKDISDSTIEVEAADLKYAANGKYKAKITVYDNHVKLTSSEYSVSKIVPENISINEETKSGTIKVTIEGKKNYAKERTVEIQVKETLISSAKVTVAGKYYYDNGAEVCPSIDALEVTIGSGRNKQVLIPEKDFIIEGYQNNIKTGNATVTIRGTGKFGGTKSVKYKILPKWMQKK